MWSLELLAACVVPLGPRGSEVRSGGSQVWGESGLGSGHHFQGFVVVAPRAVCKRSVGETTLT